MNPLWKKVFTLEKKQRKKFFIKYSFEKSKEALKEVQFNIDNDFLNTAQSKLYYAIYYAVSGLAYTEEFKTSKHAQLMGWFNKEFIYNRKIFNPYYFKLYKNAYENRKKADYEFTYKAVKEDIEKDLAESIDFIEAIEKYINGKL